MNEGPGTLTMPSHAITVAFQVTGDMVRLILIRDRAETDPSREIGD